ncbi:MAG TPA: phosphoribosyltransferase family protein [Acidimicrobiales bacterium]|nr:phosphoribosyltransferase family protein [Acidimicrobiales bacterium]
MATDLLDRGTDVVVGLPRGGVPVAAVVARSLGVPLDVIIVRKLGAPRQPELAMGAVGEDGVTVVNERVVRGAGVRASELQRAIEAAQIEIAARAHRLRAGRDRVPLSGRTAVIVDDGLATGATARAACLVARGHGAARIIVAVPVAPRRALAKLGDVADEVVCLSTPASFHAVGQAYRHFEPTSDEEVLALLRRAADPSHEDP